MKVRIIGRNSHSFLFNFMKLFPKFINFSVITYSDFVAIQISCVMLRSNNLRLISDCMELSNQDITKEFYETPRERKGLPSFGSLAPSSN